MRAQLVAKRRSGDILDPSASLAVCNLHRRKNAPGRSGWRTIADPGYGVEAWITFPPLRQIHRWARAVLAEES